MRKTTSVLLVLSGMVIGGVLTSAIMSAIAQQPNRFQRTYDSTSQPDKNPTLQARLDELDRDIAARTEQHRNIGRFTIVQHPQFGQYQFMLDTATGQCWQFTHFKDTDENAWVATPLLSNGKNG